MLYNMAKNLMLSLDSLGYVDTALYLVRRQALLRNYEAIELKITKL